MDEYTNRGKSLGANLHDLSAYEGVLQDDTEQNTRYKIQDTSEVYGVTNILSILARATVQSHVDVGCFSFSHFSPCGVNGQEKTNTSRGELDWRVWRVWRPRNNAEK